ncbi:sugar phosphate isomerase/epimerase family protein [Bacillus sp. B1-b2]|uniref:sugar phosphate isomerase/epimerase family protein n=1 Tax=Bacillus sp. B1-b2 TaxID=2653201 RepID=UPI00126164E8|nr:sugar phosphate isomerase/epimerase [Bacillus sp. B1-b2]KAB7668368.1 sugar phosphate isomerase/epimerase [Bacillus sp. B1-b2]
MARIKRAVSLYSYQDEYVRGKLNLEDCMKELSELGVEGVEIISDQMLKNAPFVSEEDIKDFRHLVRKYQVDPVCNDIFINTNLYKNRERTQSENLDQLKDEIRLAHKLGIKLIRLVSATPADIIEAAIPLCEELDVAIAQEIHAGMGFDHPKTKAYIDIMLKLKSPYCGLVVDTGIFCKKHPRVSTAFFKDQGLSEEIAEYIDSIFEAGSDPRGKSSEDVLPENIRQAIKSGTDRMYLLFSDGYEQNDFSVMDEYMPYIYHFHGKFFEIMEDGTEYSIPYKELIDYLKAKNYNGYIASEYEGGRFALPGIEVDAVSQVRKHQELLKQCIEGVE